jgi:hypothetical protein
VEDGKDVYYPGKTVTLKGEWRALRGSFEVMQVI